MSRMRDAIRSGWNTSKSVSFSPVEANRMGRPVTEATDRAAPPRASPSSLESTTPVKPTPSAKACAVSTASWPIIASMTKIVSSGLDGVADVRGLLHELGVDAEAAGGVDDDDVVLAGARASATPSRATPTGSPVGTSSSPADAGVRREHRHAGALGDDGELGHGVGALEVGRDEQRRVPLRAQVQRELAGERRLPGALQAREHDDGRRVLGQRAAGGARRRGSRRAPR